MELLGEFIELINLKHSEMCLKLDKMLNVLCMLNHFSRVQLCDTLWNVAHQVHGILQIRILERVAMPSSRAPS